MRINHTDNSDMVSNLPIPDRVLKNRDHVTGSTDYDPFDKTWDDMHRGEFDDMARRERIDIATDRHHRNGGEWD
jgi:hypothetical protein